MKYIESIKIFSLIVAFVVVSIVPNYVLAQTANPPAGNPPAPVNVGLDYQLKEGILGFSNSLFVNLSDSPLGLFVKSGLSVFGNVDTINKTILDIYGNISIRGGNPGANKILTSTDNLGNTTWKSLSELGGGGTGNVDNGTEEAQTLFWDSTISKWVPNSLFKILPVANLGIFDGILFVNDLRGSSLRVGPFISLNRETDAGKITYTTGSRQSTNIYGGGSSVGDRLIKLFDNVEVGGDINVGGDVYTCTEAGSCTLVGDNPFHSADLNKDWVISQDELNQFISLYNNTQYQCNSEDPRGYSSGSGNRSCSPHSADVDGNWSLSLSENLRVIQLFNLGGYSTCRFSEDGFRPINGPCSANTSTAQNNVDAGTANNQTLRWNGTKWVPSSNLINDEANNQVRVREQVFSGENDSTGSDLFGSIKILRGTSDIENILGDTFNLRITGAPMFGLDSPFRMVAIDNILGVPHLFTNNATFNGIVRIINGTQGEGKVLVSDANGNATWRATSTIGIGGQDNQDVNWIRNGNNISNTNSGNVGIGTNNPSRKLDINGGAIIRGADRNTLSLTTGNSTINDTAGLVVNNRAAFYYDGPGQSVVISDSNANKDIVFMSGRESGETSLERLRIDNTTGNVGIGVQDPQFRLDVAGGAIRVRPTAAIGLVIQTDTGSSMQLIRTNDNTPETQQGGYGQNAQLMLATPARHWNVGTWTGNGKFFIHDWTVGQNGPFNEGNRFVIDTIGRVGISNDNPGSALSVGNGVTRYPAVDLTVSPFKNRTTSNQDNTGIELSVPQSSGGIGYSHNTGIQFYVNKTTNSTTGGGATLAATFSQNGNVGIGIPAGTSATSKLDVNGQIRIRGGAPGINKVLTSDANGLATWRTLTEVGGGSTYTAATNGGLILTGTAFSIADRGVTSNRIALGAVNNDHFVNNSLSGVKIQDNSLNGSKLIDNSINGSKLIDNTVTANKIQNGSITGNKLSQMGATNGQVLKWNGSTWIPSVDNVGSNLPTGSNNQTLRNSNGQWVANSVLVTTNNTVAVNGYMVVGQDAAFLGNLSVLGSDGILETQGKIRIRGGNPSTDRVLVSTNNSGDAEWKSINQITGAGLPTGTNGQILRNSSGQWVSNSAIFIANNSNVGVGNTNPQQRLDVNGGLQTNRLFVTPQIGVPVANNQVLVSTGGNGQAVWSSIPSAIFTASFNKQSGTNSAFDRLSGSDSRISVSVQEDSVWPFSNSGARDFVTLTCPQNTAAISGGAICDRGNPISANGPGNSSREWRISCGDQLSYIQKVSVTCSAVNNQ